MEESPWQVVGGRAEQAQNQKRRRVLRELLPGLLCPVELSRQKAAIITSQGGHGRKVSPSAIRVGRYKLGRAATGARAADWPTAPRLGTGGEVIGESTIRRGGRWRPHHDWRWGTRQSQCQGEVLGACVVRQKGACTTLNAGFRFLAEGMTWLFSVAVVAHRGMCHSWTRA